MLRESFFARRKSECPVGVKKCLLVVKLQLAVPGSWRRLPAAGRVDFATRHTVNFASTSLSLLFILAEVLSQIFSSRLLRLGNP